MRELLDWIAMNQGPAFVMGVLFLFFCGIVASVIRSFLKFIQNALCAFTGKYPPPRPSVECNCAKPCKCCRENDCQANCGCWADKQDAEYIESE